MVGLFLRHYVLWIHSCGVKCTSKRVFCQNVWMICIIQYIIQYKCTIWNSLIIHIQFTMEMNFVSKWSTVICNVFLSSNKPTKIWWRFLSTVVFQFCSIQYFVIFFLSKIVLTQIQILQVHMCENSLQYFNLIARFFTSRWFKSANICDIMDSNKYQFKICLVNTEQFFALLWLFSKAAFKIS